MQLCFSRLDSNVTWQHWSVSLTSLSADPAWRFVRVEIWYLPARGAVRAKGERSRAARRTLTDRETCSRQLSDSLSCHHKAATKPASNAWPTGRRHISTSERSLEAFLFTEKSTAVGSAGQRFPSPRRGTSAGPYWAFSKWTLYACCDMYTNRMSKLKP